MAWLFAQSLWEDGKVREESRDPALGGNSGDWRPLSWSPEAHGDTVPSASMLEGVQKRAEMEGHPEWTATMPSSRLLPGICASLAGA